MKRETPGIASGVKSLKHCYLEGVVIRTAYRFSFEPEVSMDDVEKALALSTVAVESIHGEQAMMIDGKFAVLKRART